MSADLTTGIVRVLTPEGTTAGTGFVVNDGGVIATCSHVVQSEESQRRGDPRPDYVDVAFHATADPCRARVEPKWWRPANAEDVAILRLEGPLPEGVTPLPLGSSYASKGHPFSSRGYRLAEHFSEGLEAEGKIQGSTSYKDHPVLQLLTNQIDEGMSGAPVWDVNSRRVVGMVNFFWETRRHIDAWLAFATPSETIQAICPALQVSDVCPYRSLDAFTEADVPFFFGRQRVVERLVVNLRREPRFLAVLGPSGSGKSSLVQAGLIPQLRQGAVPGGDRWGAIVARPADQPFGQLEAQGLAGASEGLAEAVGAWLDRHPEQTRLVLVVDQFEELLITCPEEVRQAFVAQLTELLDASLPVTVVLVMRDDFYSRFAGEALTLLAWLERGLVNVPPLLARDELRAIVEEPARTVGVTFEAGLVEAILEDAMESAPEGEGRAGRSTILPLLEFALTQLWERRQDGVLTHEVYGAIGGVTGGLAQWADRAYYGLEEKQQRLAMRVLTDLVHLGDESQGLPDSRRRRPLDALFRDEREREAVHRVVRRLADARLLVTRRDLQSGQETVELIHDALLREWGLFQGWLRDDRRFLAWRQGMEGRVRAWVESGPDAPAQRDEGRLLRGRDLAEAERWLAERGYDLSQDERACIRESMSLREREQAARRRRRRQVILGLVTGLVVTLALLLVVGILWRRTDEQRQTTLSRQLAAQAINVADSQYDLALLLSLQAYNIADTTEARAALLDVLEYNPRLTTFLEHHNYRSLDVAFSPDGQTLASTGCLDASYPCDASAIRLWNVTTGQLIGQPFTTTGFLSDSTFSPDGQMLALISVKNNVVLWDVGTGQFIAPSFAHNAASIAFSPDGQILASGGFDNKIILWDVATGQPIGQSFIGHTSYALSVAFSPDGKTLASGDEDGLVRLWDVATAQLIGQPLIGHAGPVYRVAFSSDGKMLVSGGLDGSCILWDIATYKPIFRQYLDALGYEPGKAAANLAIALSQDDRILAVGYRNTITLWDVATQQPLGQPLSGHTAFVWHLAFSPDGKTLASVALDNKIIQWDIAARRRLGRQLPTGHSDWMCGVASSPDGQILASGSWDDTIILWDVATGQPIGQPLTGHTAAVSSVAFSPDGQLLASGSGDDTIILWDVATGQPIGQPLTGHTDDVRSVVFSPDGATLASGSVDETIVLWDAATGQLRQRLVGGGWKTSLAFSPDGKTLASTGGVASSIRLWDITTGKPVYEPLTGDTPLPNNLGVAFSPDGATVASSGINGVILWDVATGQLIGQISMENNAPVDNIAFSPDGKILASSACTRLGPPHCLEGDIGLWDVSTLKSLGRIPPSNTGAVNVLAFSPDGQTLASNSSDSAIILWDLSFASWQARACRVANRNLTMDEWNQFIGLDTPYERTCPNLPPGKDAPPDAPAAYKSVAAIEPTVTLQAAVAEEQITATPAPIFEPTPTPTQQPTVTAGAWRTEISNLPDGLSLVFPAIIQCRESGDSDQLVQEYLGIWAVRVDRKHECISDGSAEVVLETDDGVEVERYDIDFSLAANETGWLMSNQNKDGYVMSGSESVTSVLKLSVRDVEWESVSEMVSQYRYEVELEGHGMYGNSAYPQHVAVFKVHNLSDLTMRDVQFWGAVENQQGDTVDILHQGGPLDLAPDRVVSFVLRSRSTSGRCVGPADSEGYTLHYWLTFETEDGQQVTRYDTPISPEQ